MKNQCSGDYFYGADEKLESAINSVENGYAGLLPDMLNVNARVDARLRIVLQRFIYLQHLRTELSSRNAAKMLLAMYDIPGQTEPTPNLKDAARQAVHSSMLAYSDTMRMVDDLAVCIIRNSSGSPFITSDNPAIETNRWHLQDPRTAGRGFGAGSAGAIFLLPLSPDRLAMLYDADVYAIPERGGVVDLVKRSDVEALNAHQVLNCMSNLYFRRWEDRPLVTAQASRAAPYRPSTPHTVHHAVLADRDGWGARYDVQDRETLEPGREILIRVVPNAPRPIAWPSFLNLRPDGVVYSNGTGAGFKRWGVIQAGFVSGQNYRPYRA